MSDISTRGSKIGRAPIVLVLIFVAMFVTFCASPTGYLAVKAACKKDGGYTVTSTVFVSGYEVREGTLSLCVTCLHDIAAKNFDFVDYVVRLGDNDTGKNSSAERYLLIERGDPQCSRLEESAMAQRFVDQLTIPEDKCIGVIGIGKTSPHVYEHTNRQLRSAMGAMYRLTEYKIFSQETNRELAAYRRYSHLPILFRKITQGAVPLWTCGREDPPFNSAQFRTSVLRDKSKLRSE